MKEARIYRDDSHNLKVLVHDVSIPTPAPDEVLIRVVVSGSNPKDWKFLSVFPERDGFNSGDDIAGVVEAAGSEAMWEFKPGDRVAAFHTMMGPSGSYAEYAIATAALTFHIPARTTFEEAATIPLAAMTAALGLFSYLGLPEPWVGACEARTRVRMGGIIVYGASSATGAFAIKLLQHADLHPILCVAGNGIPFAESLIDPTKGDRVIDYRQGNDSVVKSLADAVPWGQTCLYAYDAVSTHQSTDNIAKVLDPQGHITLLWPLGDYPSIPKSVHQTKISVGIVQQDKNFREFAHAWLRLFGYGLQHGWFSGHPYQVCEGGLLGVETGLRNLVNGRASAVNLQGPEDPYGLVTLW